MLRPVSELHGYSVLALDGSIGHVSDILVDDKSWLVRRVVVETGNWLTDRKVLLPPFVLGHINHDRREFSVKLNRAQVKDSPSIDTDRSVSRQMETNVYLLGQRLLRGRRRIRQRRHGRALLRAWPSRQRQSLS